MFLRLENRRLQRGSFFSGTARADHPLQRQVIRWIIILTRAMPRKSDSSPNERSKRSPLDALCSERRAPFSRSPHRLTKSLGKLLADLIASEKLQEINFFRFKTNSLKNTQKLHLTSPDSWRFN